jgi:hypothetical protein
MSIWLYESSGRKRKLEIPMALRIRVEVIVSTLVEELDLFHLQNTGECQVNDFPLHKLIQILSSQSFGNFILYHFIIEVRIFKVSIYQVFPKLVLHSKACGPLSKSFRDKMFLLSACGQRVRK